jgi:hypothetical protein
MMNLKVLAIVISASALSSTAALAQAALSNPDACQAEFSSCTGLGTGTTPVYGHRRAVYHRPVTSTTSVASWSDSTGEMAWHGSWNAYAAHNGIVCKPGTYYKGADGLRHVCQ